MTDQPKDMTPSELEEFIQERVNAQHEDERVAYWNIYAPLGDGWNRHLLIVQKSGVSSRQAVPGRTARCSLVAVTLLMQVSSKVEYYLDDMEDAWACLDGGCHGFDTDPSWTRP
jgi:hypothetical protein